MIILETSKQTSQENFKVLTGTIIPRPIAWVSTMSPSGYSNIAPFSYFNLVSTEEPMISISIRRDGGLQKDTSKNILATKEFVVHTVSLDYLAVMNASSFPLEYEVSEIDALGLTLQPSHLVKVQGIKEAKVRLECVYQTHVSFESTDLFIGKVVAIQVDEEIYDQGKIDIKKLQIVSRLAGANYGLIGEVIPVAKPERIK
jgi:flavin reductase (DIM6/NTAB) family NADH-FMN oxidoreductase RutF